MVGSTALWALPFLYVDGVSSPVKGAILRMITQKLLWISGNRLVMHSVYLGKTVNISYSDVGKHERIIKEWKCNGTNLTSCYQHIVKAMVQHQALDKGDEQITQHWFQALAQIGYNFSQGQGESHINCSPEVLFNFVDYRTNELEHEENKRHTTPITNLGMVTEIYSNTCSKHTNLTLGSNFMNPWMQFDKILLLVVFNKPHYKSIPYIETLYRPFFPYILYCVPGIPDFNLPNARGVKNFHFSFYAYNGTKAGFPKAAFNYECMEAAIKMQFSVEGIFFLADDLLVSIHHLMNLNFRQAWYIEASKTVMANVVTNKKCVNGICNKKYSWSWWVPFTEKSRHLLKRMAQAANTSVVGKCYRQLIVNNGGVNRLNGGLADVYYIPKKLVSDFLTLSTFFRQEHMWLEITVPTIIQCTEGFKKTQVLQGLAVWDKTRDTPWFSITKEKFQNKVFLHPTKWSYVANGNLQYIDFYCNTVLPWMHDRNGRIPK